MKILNKAGIIFSCMLLIIASLTGCASTQGSKDDKNKEQSVEKVKNINISYVKAPLNVPSIIEKKVRKLMEAFNIGDLIEKYPYYISGGQKQRAAAARALANNPAVIYADEPTGNLDSKSSDSIMNTIAKMNEEMNSTVFMVTHDPFAASFCKRIIFIKDGRIKLEIASSGDRKKFFDKILEVQSFIGGED